MKVLFIRYSALGDIVLATGVIELFQRKFPEAEIHILTDSSGKEIFSEMPFIKSVFNIREMGLLKTLNTLPRYDYVFDFQGKLKSKLVSLSKGREKFCIFKNSAERRKFVKTKKVTDGLSQHITQRYFQASLGALNIKEPSIEFLKPKLSLNNYKSELQLPEDFIAIHPYASQANKVWPYFHELIDELISNSKNIVIVGHGELISFNSRAINLVSKTSVKDLLHVIKSSKLLITTDSGPLHIASGFNIPTISLFGPTTKDFGFYPQYSESAVIENNNLNCRPCHVHGGNKCPLKHFDCMKSLSVKDVIGKINL